MSAFVIFGKFLDDICDHLHAQILVTLFCLIYQEETAVSMSLYHFDMAWISVQRIQL